MVKDAPLKGVPTPTLYKQAFGDTFVERNTWLLGLVVMSTRNHRANTNTNTNQRHPKKNTQTSKQQSSVSTLDDSITFNTSIDNFFNLSLINSIYSASPWGMYHVQSLIHLLWDDKKPQKSCLVILLYLLLEEKCFLSLLTNGKM